MAPWLPVSKIKLGIFSLCLGLFIIIMLRSESGYVPLLDGANLLFHEAGHVAFGLLGGTASLYGGTLGQFDFPMIVIFGFWRQHAPRCSRWWAAENTTGSISYASGICCPTIPSWSSWYGWRGGRV